MKKVLLTLGGGSVITMLLIVLIIAGAASGGVGGGAGTEVSMKLLEVEDEAYAYQYIGTELGVPWDIVLLTDVMHADRNGEKGLENYNPLYTSLEFCALVEKKYVAVIKKTESETEESKSSEESEKKEENKEESKDTEESEESKENKEKTEDEVAIEWVCQDTVVYSGRTKILQYLEMSKETLAYQDAGSIIAAINDKAQKKSVHNKVYYVATLVSEPDYEDVLKNRIGLADKDVSNIMEFYETGYLPKLYGYVSYNLGNVELPDIVVGNVSRGELAQVAVSILGHPYLMGAKSSEQGAPKGPLDCSGYVDWVYVQCFGVTVSTGELPEGVAVSGTAQQWFASEPITAKELKVGDLGFVENPSSMRAGQVNHVGIYLGTYDGNMLWIHCGGSAYGTEDSPKGRVGISKISGYNNYNPVTGNTFEPKMKSCRFRYYRRPRFTFTDD